MQIPPSHGSKKTNLVSVGTEAEVLHGLAGVLGTTEKQSVGTGGGAEGKLIQSQGLTTGLLNASASGSGETEGGNRKLGNVQQAVVIGDGTDHDNGLALLSLANVGNSAGQGNRGAVDSGHEQATEDSLVEVGLGTAYGCIRNQPHEILIKILRDTEKTPLFLRCEQKSEFEGESYEPRSGTASPEPGGRRCRSWEPCGGCSAHGGGPGRYLRVSNC